MTKGSDTSIDDIALPISDLAMREWLEQIDDCLFGAKSNIKETYDRIVALEKQHTQSGLNAAQQQELAHKFDSLVAWAQKVSKATGVALPKF